MFIFQALEVIDEVGHLTNTRYSKINKHYSLKEVREMELEEILIKNLEKNEEKQI